MTRTSQHTLFALGALALFALPTYSQQATDSVYKSITLDSVMVKARRPMVKTLGSKNIITVKGSYLSKMGNLGNMLLATPGISAVGQNQFEVVGKGTPIYYIDGREVTQQDIFKTIKAANIDRIEIERNPGAQYPSGTNAVVNIITLRPLKDIISVDLSNTATFKRKASENPSVELKVNKGIWASSLNYDYGTYGNLNKETYYTEITHPDYLFRSDESNNDYSRSFSHDLTFANDFFITPKRRLSFIYNYAKDHDKDRCTELMTYKDKDRTTEKDIVRRTLTDRSQHAFSLSYSGNVYKNSYLFLSADYSLINNDLKHTSDETYRASGVNSNILTNNDGRYNIATVNASYNFTLPLNIQANVGGRYYNTHHSLRYNTTNALVSAEQRLNHQTLNDNVTAGYATLGRSWKKVYASISGRYEYSDTRIKIASDGDTYRSSRHTSDLLPTVYVKYDPKQNLSFQAYYQRSVQRQGYMGLNPYPTYNDSLSYTSGNISLRPGYTDDYSLYATWRNLTVGFIYYHFKDAISNVTYCPDLTRNTTCEMPINMMSGDSYLVSVSYQKMFGKVFVNGMVYLTIPRFSYTYLGRTEEMRHASCSGNINMSYFINGHFTAFTNFSFQSYNQRYNHTQKAANNWTLGIQSSLLNDRLSLSLTATDILHRAHYNNLTYYYDNTRYGTYGTNDMRGVSINVSYSLFSQKLNKVKAKRNDSEIVNRTR